MANSPKRLVPKVKGAATTQPTAVRTLSIAIPVEPGAVPLIASLKSLTNRLDIKNSRLFPF
ncbi:hypothetical protein EV06_1512 [Prochlorococcus sp. MIT 0602]|nr:hypothetical protein EV06_1512 [Prochlorococcus sp. MIT 0602]KGG17163.1 hypothetical protein EV07_0598 [Prochlorococcus sp. MIT 0603]